MQFERLNRNVDNCFFGYYDRNPWNRANDRHLALHTARQDRLPRPGETAQVGYVERESGRFVPCAETRAWCHQQGSMTQWLESREHDRFLYNDFDPGTGMLKSRIFEVGNGITGEYELPVYLLSPDRRQALSLDFSRLPRRGYSYADAPLQPGVKPDPDRDGLSLLDLESGKHRLIVSYREAVKHHPLPYSLENRHWWFDHPGFNSDGTKVLFLFRDCADPLNPESWRTNLFVANIDGSDLRCVLPEVYWHRRITHQLWGRTPDEILVDANWRDAGSEYVVFDSSHLPFQAELISSGIGIAGHLIFSPDGRFLLADTYPDANQTEHLAVVNVESGRLHRLASFRHNQPPGSGVDLRCDLHPRWSADGKWITVDSTDAGSRNIHIAPFHAEEYS